MGSAAHQAFQHSKYYWIVREYWLARKGQQSVSFKAQAVSEKKFFKDLTKNCVSKSQQEQICKLAKFGTLCCWRPSSEQYWTCASIFSLIADLLAKLQQKMDFKDGCLANIFEIRLDHHEQTLNPWRPTATPENFSWIGSVVLEKKMKKSF